MKQQSELPRVLLPGVCSLPACLPWAVREGWVLHQSLLSWSLEKFQLLCIWTLRSRCWIVDGGLPVCPEGHLGDQTVGYCSVRGLLLETVKAGALPNVDVLFLRNWELPGVGQPGLHFSCPLLPPLCSWISVGQVYFMRGAQTSVGFLCDEEP